MKTGGIKKVPVPHTAGYPETGIGKDGTQIMGQFLPGTKMKSYGTVRGAGAARKGKKFLNT